jgi:anti-sigma factor RsiW
VITCKDLLERLVDFLNGELVAEHKETVEVHIKGCPKCESYVTTYSRTIKITRALPQCNKLPPAFEAKLRKLLEEELGEKAVAE